MSILATAVKVITAVPEIRKTFESVVEIYYAQKVNALEGAMITSEKKRAELINLIQKAQTNEQILLYSVMLDDYNNEQLQN